jgi:CO/xanthine dehydrogenase FAD-binding subunit
VIDSQLELRSAGSTRWPAVGELFDHNGMPDLHPGEILTRIRVPLEEWDFTLFRKVERGSCSGASNLSFAAVARLPKGGIDALHFCIGGLKNPVFRMAALETRLKNATVPVSAKLIDSLLADLDEALSEQVDDTPTGGYRKATSLRLFRWFMNRLNARTLEIL